MQLASARPLPSTPRSLLPPSPISASLAGRSAASPKPPPLAGSPPHGIQVGGTATAPTYKDARATPNTGPPAGSPTTSAATSSVFDLSTDPIVAKIQDLNAANYQQAVGHADEQRKQLLIDAGFPDLARAAQFGSLESPVTGDEATALAAQKNPYSTAANLALANTQADQGIDKTENAANLYFSSDRANQLGSQAHTYLGNVSSAESQVEQQLSAILQSLLQTRSGEQSTLADDIETARQNAINTAISSGQSFIGYDANGNPIFGGGAAPAASATLPPPPPPPAPKPAAKPKATTVSTGRQPGYQ